MVPLRLRLKNFMCYRDNVPPISFEGIHVACLCGDNGNGKSALLDAITWALWGRARAKSDDELIHLGRSDMEVDFEFMLGDDRYRVLRARTRARPNRPGQPMLDLQVATESGYRSIAGNSIRETERAIVGLLRMDYETFTNSAFLLQGRADLFTVMEPHRRKEVLADILGLGRYQEYEERAKMLARERARDEHALRGDIEAIDGELAHRDEHSQKLADVRGVLVALKKELKTQEEKVSRLREQRQGLDLERQHLEETNLRIEQVKAELGLFQRQIAAHQARIEEFESVLAGHHDDLAQADAHLRQVTEMEERLAERKQEYEEASNRSHYLTLTNKALKEEMEGLKAKIVMLSGDEATCPLCGTELAAEGRERTIASYEAQGQEKAHLFRSNEEEVKRLGERLASLRHETESLEGAIREQRSRWQGRREALERAHLDAERNLPKEREDLTHAEEALERWRSTLQADVERQRSLIADIAGLPQVESDLRQAQALLDDYVERERRERDQAVELEARLKDLAAKEEARRDKEQALLQASQERALYDELAVAFGKKGIQALIIESALPEIEEEANRLLARMTDGRMHIKLEAQRQTRKGDTVETLDINISDELGTRRYETYSGGEAFRINFALRIALSRLLARRAGAPLPTLFIDEGFGTQDASGRERVVEAIGSIEDDFERIIVITHIDEMKERFPVRIEVTKTEEGSTVHMV